MSQFLKIYMYHFLTAIPKTFPFNNLYRLWKIFENILKIQQGSCEDPRLQRPVSGLWRSLRIFKDRVRQRYHASDINVIHTHAGRVICMTNCSPSVCIQHCLCLPVQGLTEYEFPINRSGQIKKYHTFSLL